MSNTSSEPIVLSEKGYDQSEVPSEMANSTPDVDPKAVEKANATDASESES